MSGDTKDWNKEDLLGEYLISLTSSMISSRASRTWEQIQAASCRQRFRQWARQCTWSAAGCSLLICAATPRRWPDMLDVLSYTWPLHWLNGRIQGHLSTHLLVYQNLFLVLALSLLDVYFMCLINPSDNYTHLLLVIYIRCHVGSTSPRFSYCKRQKLDVEAWERGYQIRVFTHIWFSWTQLNQD